MKMKVKFYKDILILLWREITHILLHLFALKKLSYLMLCWYLLFQIFTF